MKALTIILVLSTAILNAQDLKESGMDHFNNQRWEEASKDLKKYLKKNDSDSSMWFNLAVAQKNIGQYEEAFESLEEAESRDFLAIRIHYNRAKIYALMKNGNAVGENLNKAAEAGMARFTNLESDTDFEAYRENEAYQQALKKMKNNAYPCREDENSRHFDFWIGEWDVYVGETKVGVNSITRAIGGCAIHESYVTAGPYAGQSINFYDPIDEKWHQHWVGSSGDVYNYLEVDKSPGMLQFQSDFLFGGQRSISRLTFRLLENGDVSQLFESSTDGGESWTNAFHGIYKKKN